MSVKQQLCQLCTGFVMERIAAAQKAIDEARESSAGETKSSAGDKYETGRAMMQLEVEKNSKQLAEAQKLLQIINSIDTSKVHTHAGLGSIVKTDSGNYFITISIGKLDLNTESYFAISPGTPMGQILLGKRKGEKVVFSGKTIEIKEVL